MPRWCEPRGGRLDKDKGGPSPNFVRREEESLPRQPSTSPKFAGFLGKPTSHIQRRPRRSSHGVTVGNNSFWNIAISTKWMPFFYYVVVPGTVLSLTRQYTERSRWQRQLGYVGAVQDACRLISNNRTNNRLTTPVFGINNRTNSYVVAQGCQFDHRHDVDLVQDKARRSSDKSSSCGGLRVHLLPRTATGLDADDTKSASSSPLLAVPSRSPST